MDIPSYHRRITPKPVGKAPIPVSAADVGAGAIGQGLQRVGRGISDIGNVLFQIKKEQLALSDAINTTKANAFVIAEEESFSDYMNNNDPGIREGAPSDWEIEREKSWNRLRENIAGLSLSNEARKLMEAKLFAYGKIRDVKIRTAQSSVLKKQAESFLQQNLQDAIQSGDEIKIADAIGTFNKNTPSVWGPDKVTADAIFEKAVKDGTKEFYIDQSKLVPDDIIEEMKKKKKALGKGGKDKEGLGAKDYDDITASAYSAKALASRAFDDRAGEAVEKWFKGLIDGTGTEQDIIKTDLQAVGEEKTKEVTLKRQWQQIYRDTIKLSEPLVSNETVYDSLVVGSEQVERGAKSPAEWELEYAQAWADGKLEKGDRRDLRSKDIVATKTMQNRAFSEGTTNTYSRLVELRDDELTGLIAARDNAVQIKDLKTVNALNFSIKKAQVQKWNYGRFKTALRNQISQNENWSQKQIFVAADILADQYDKDVSDLMIEFENANPDQSILKTPPDNEFKDIWEELPMEDKAKIWELRLMGAMVKEILGSI